MNCLLINENNDIAFSTDVPNSDFFSVGDDAKIQWLKGAFENGNLLLGERVPRNHQELFRASYLIQDIYDNPSVTQVISLYNKFCSLAPEYYESQDIDRLTCTYVAIQACLFIVCSYIQTNSDYLELLRSPISASKNSALADEITHLNHGDRQRLSELNDAKEMTVLTLRRTAGFLTYCAIVNGIIDLSNISQKNREIDYYFVKGSELHDGNYGALINTYKMFINTELIFLSILGGKLRKSLVDENFNMAIASFVSFVGLAFHLKAYIDSYQDILSEFTVSKVSQICRENLKVLVTFLEECSEELMEAIMEGCSKNYTSEGFSNLLNAISDNPFTLIFKVAGPYFPISKKLVTKG